MKKFLLSLMSIFCLLSVSAQEDALLKAYNSLILSKDSLEKVLKAKEEAISELNTKIASLQAENNNLKQQIGTVDSIARQKEQSLAVLADSLKNKEMSAAEIDMLRIKFANSRLMYPYSLDKVNEGIAEFNKVQDANLKQQYAGVKTFLLDYSTANREIKEVLNDIQNNNREGTDVNAWKTRMKKKLDSTKYRQSVGSGNFSIPFLDKVINAAKNKIDNVKSPVDIVKVNFSDLILFMQ